MRFCASGCCKLTLYYDIISTDIEPIFKGINLDQTDETDIEHRKGADKLMKKPVILMTAHYEPWAMASPYVGLNTYYYDAVQLAGGTPVLIPYSADLDDYLLIGDGLILTGGYDIAPALYNEEVLYNTVKVTPERDVNEVAVFERWSKTGKPILGICRGLQFLNVILGGTLYQDIPVQRSVIHSGTEHSNTVEQDNKMSDWFDVPTIVTNSFHHQGIKDLAPGLVPVIYSEDGLIEGVIHESLPYYATQFHPERMVSTWKPQNQTDMSTLFSKFISICK